MSKPRTQTAEIIERQREEIKRGLSILATDDQVIEVRIPKVAGKKTRTDAGYFQDREALARAATTYNGRAHGIYFTLNPVNPALFSRAANRIEEWSELTTSDNDISCRRWLPLDLDPNRPSGISSTNAEHEAALARAREIREWLTAQGWPEPLFGDSGNGAHLLYRIDLPNDQTASDLVQKCLQAIAAKWDDQAIHTDTTVFNPARIWKLYGTKAGKGDDTDERPHRWAYLVEVPPAVECVPLELLQALATLAPAAPTPAPAARPQTYSGPDFDIEDFIARNVATLNPSPEKRISGGSARWRIDCPWDPSHRGDAVIIQLPGGALSAKCSHNSCNWDWHDLRARLEPRAVPSAPSHKPMPATTPTPTAAPSEPPPSAEADMSAAAPPPEPENEDAGGASLEALAAELGTMADSAAAEQWAVDRITTIAQLPEPQYLKLRDELKKRKVPQLFLDRTWLPAVKRQAEGYARTSAPSNDGQQRTERYRVIAHRIHEAREHVDQATGNVSIDWRPLCNFDARIIADVAEDDGEHVTRKLAIAGTLATGEPLSEVTIDADDFEQMSWPIKEWGARVSIEPGRGVKDKLRHAIQALSDAEMETRRIYAHTGWRVIDGERVFLTASGGLGREGISITLPPQLHNYALPQDEALDVVTAMRASIALLDVAPYTISAPLWAAMYLATLSEIIPPAFTVWVEGESGSLKSSLSAVMLNHYGAGFTEFKLPAGWDGTANSLERLCFHAKDIPLLIDDFRPVTNRFESQKLQDAASKIIRAAGNRQGRSRLDSESEFRRVFAPRGLVLATAERGALGKSTNARLLTIDVGLGDIDPVRLAQAQAQRAVYSYAMAGYVRWVGQRYEQLRKDLPETVNDVRARQNGNGHHKRLPGAMAALYVAFHLAMEYAIEIGAIDTAVATDREERCYAALQSISNEQAELVAAQDPAWQFLQVIVTLLRAGQVLIQDKDTVNSRPLGAEGPGVERIGWHDDLNVYLLSNAFNRVVRYLQAQGEAFPSDEITLNKELARRGIITDKKPGDGRNKQQRFDPGQSGQRVRVITISLAKFKEAAQNTGIAFDDLVFTPKEPR